MVKVMVSPLSTILRLYRGGFLITSKLLFNNYKHDYKIEESDMIVNM